MAILGKLTRSSFAANIATAKDVTRVTTPVAGTTAGAWRFTKAHEVIRLMNASTKILYVFVNDSMVNMEGTPLGPSVTEFSHIVADGAVIDLGEASRIPVKTVAIWVPTGGNLAQIFFQWWE